MKSLFLSLCFCLSLSPLMAITARSYDDALRKAGDNRAVVLFCYGANYDRISELRYEEFIKQRKIMRATRGCVFMEVPIYQLPDEKQKKDYERIMNGKSLPGGIWSYPCLAVLDGKGNLRGVVQSAEEMKDAETAGEALSRLLKAFDEQQSLLTKASRASGSRQERLLIEAADVDLRLPKQLPGSAADNERLNFDPIAVMTNLQPMEPDEANAYIRNMMAKGCYTRRQRQEMMMAYAGHLRRLKASPERLRALYMEMRNIDPGSMYAAYAEEAIRLWAQPAEEAAAEAPGAGTATGLGDRERPGFD